jgi:hypothetical protein
MPPIVLATAASQSREAQVTHADAETYLRLRAEAELRRAQTLPPDDDADDADDAAEPEPAELTSENGLHQLSAVAHVLAQTGAIGKAAADSVTQDLAAALFARARFDPHDLADLLEPHQGQPTRAPSGPYLAAPVGVTVPGGQGSGLTEIQIFALVIAPDRALLTTAGRQRKPPRRRRSHGWLPFDGSAEPTVTDDRGSSYRVHADSSSSDGDGNWTAMLSLSPVPQPGTRWLELTVTGGSPPVRVDLGSTSASASGAAAAEPVAAASPAERVVDAEAHRLLHAALMDPYGDLSWYDLSEIADIVAALDAVGALGTGRGRVGSLITLAGQFHVPIPPALTAVAQPAGLPDVWRSILDNRDRDDGPFALAPAAAVLPELGGTRFVLAGMRSGAGGAVLQALGWSLPEGPRFSFFTDAAKQWSWTARDDRGRWHVATDGSGSSSDEHADMELEFVPALHPEARSLEVTVAGPSGQVSATVPLDWWGEQ